MKKIKTINKLLSSLTLLSPLLGIGFNSQYQSTQKVITENSNNSLINYVANQTNEQKQMGDITVTIEGTTITGFVSSSGEGKLIVDSDITKIADNAFDTNTNITSVDLSQATSLTTIGKSAFSECDNLKGDLVIPSNVTSIGEAAFNFTIITSLDLSQATRLTTIGRETFSFCEYLTGNITIPSSVTVVGQYAFNGTNITSLDLSQATSLTTIENYAFSSIINNITEDLVIPSSVTNIGTKVFLNDTLESNLIFKSETSPTFGESWQPTVTGKVYVPTEQAKQAYLSAENFGFTEDQVVVSQEPSKSNTGLVLGLVFGLGIPIILAAGFGIWYFTKKKKTTVKI